MDILEAALIDSYCQYYNGTLKVDYVLGFEIDHRVTNFSVLGDDYTYSTVDLSCKQVPGLLLKEQKTLLCREQSPIDADKFRLNFKHMFDIGVKASYNGVDLVVHTIYSPSPEIATVRYVDVVLAVYKAITGTTLGMFLHKYEAENSLAKIPHIKYTPTTVTYAEFLDSIAIASASDDNVCVNNKYDGYAMWLYMSPTTPACLLYQIKTRKHVQQKYIGRVASKADKRLDGSYCLHLERIETNGEYSYIVTDAFMNNETNTYSDYSTYSARMEKAHRVVTEQSPDCCIMLPIKFTVSCISNCASLATVDAIHNRATIKYVTNAGYTNVTTKRSYCCPVNVLMSQHIEHTDGYVAYVGSNRPTKIKLASMITLDLEYSKSRKQWCNLQQEFAPDDPPFDVLMSTENDIVVVEVNVSNGRIVRIRPDRTKGNSRSVVENVMRTYGKDLKYSNMQTWAGEDIRFSILVNRMFKRYMHIKYMLKNSNVLDAGSGNGGDLYIWKDMGYKILAIEKDRNRYEVLSKKLANATSMKAVNDDMRNMLAHLGKSAARYHSASFMRSLGTLTDAEVSIILAGLKAYGCKRILIVIMVTDWLVTHSYKYNNQAFNIVYNNNDKVDVEYIVDREVVRYTDNCYSLNKWLEIATGVGYSAIVERQEEFVTRAYNLQPTSSTYPCFTDVGLYLYSA